MVITPRLEKVLEMNMPNIQPTLTWTDPNDRVIDQVFCHVVRCQSTRNNRYNVDVYYDEDWSSSASQKELTLEDVRKWWNTCVKHGYNRK